MWEHPVRALPPPCISQKQYFCTAFQNESCWDVASVPHSVCSTTSVLLTEGCFKFSYPLKFPHLENNFRILSTACLLICAVWKWMKIQWKQWAADSMERFVPQIVFCFTHYWNASWNFMFMILLGCNFRGLRVSFWLKWSGSNPA